MITLRRILAILEEFGYVDSSVEHDFNRAAITIFLTRPPTKELREEIEWIRPKDYTIVFERDDDEFLLPTLMI